MIYLFILLLPFLLLLLLSCPSVKYRKLKISCIHIYIISKYYGRASNENWSDSACFMVLMMFTLTSMEGEAEMVGVNTCLHVHTFP